MTNKSSKEKNDRVDTILAARLPTAVPNPDVKDWSFTGVHTVKGGKCEVTCDDYDLELVDSSHIRITSRVTGLSVVSHFTWILTGKGTSR